jgi:glycosyltransferase involved in cell wall biosynthesis
LQTDLKGRIVFAVTNDLTGDQRMQRIAGALAAHGYDVTLIGRKSMRNVDSQGFQFKASRLNCLCKKGKAFYIEFNIRLFWKLLFTPADVFGAVDLDTILPVLAVSKLRGKLSTYDAHEYFTEVPEVHERPRIKAFWKWVEKFAIPRMDACYTVSQSIANLFDEEYGVRFEVIRNVAERKEMGPKLTGEKYVLYQGALNRGRGLEALIDAMPELDCKLKIAGSGDVEEALKGMVKEKGLENKVDFLGFLRPQQLHEVTSGAFLGYNILVDDGKSYYYSLANKTFDYMQAGIPVLCSPFPEYIALEKEHPFIYFSHADSDSIARAIRYLLDYEESYQRLCDAAVAAKGVVNWELEQVKLKHLYDGLLARQIKTHKL